MNDGRCSGIVAAPSLRRTLFACLAVCALIAGCDDTTVEPGTASPGGRDDMSHGDMSHDGSIDVVMPGLCRLRTLVRADDPKTYETYSSEIHNPLHEFMNELRDANTRGARPVLQSENRLEISLLSDVASGRTQKHLAQLIKDLRPRLRESGYSPNCG